MSRSRYADNDQTELRDLDELRAPPPVRDTQQSSHNRSDPYLEDRPLRTPSSRKRDSYLRPHRTTSGQQEEGLDEIAASAPARHDNRRASGNALEDQPAKPTQTGLTLDSISTLITLSYLIFFSFLGVLARLGLQWLTFYPGAPVVTSVLWANVGGSFFMGFLSEDRRLFQQPEFSAKNRPKPDLSDDELKAHHGKVKKTIPLYVGLATGFCGSFTSFSSFIRDAYLALANELPSPYSHPLTAGSVPPGFSSTYPRNDGYGFLAVLAVLIYEVGLSLGALFVGAHTALALQRWIPGVSFRLTRHFLDPLMVLIAWGCWLATIFIVVFVPDHKWRGEVLFALVFAPAGTLCRFYASLKLNPLIATFPMGTFAVNIFGSIVLALSYDLQRVSLNGMVGGGVVGCQVLQGIEDGFCGCLTTVSTWVAEIQGLRRRHGYIYALGSMLVALCMMIVIMGSVRWSVGWGTPVCTTMRTSS